MHELKKGKLLLKVLLVMVKSIIFQYQLTQRRVGTILMAVPQNSIKDIFVPNLSKQTQQKITDLVRKSHAARQKSEELLEKAKTKVEELIDNK